MDLTQAQAGELLVFENGLRALVLNLEEDNVGAVMLGDSKDIHEGRYRKTHQADRFR
jgi:F-type H+-transporting ATPase subunit alpha